MKKAIPIAPYREPVRPCRGTYDIVNHLNKGTATSRYLGNNITSIDSKKITKAGIMLQLLGNRLRNLLWHFDDNMLLNENRIDTANCQTNKNGPNDSLPPNQTLAIASAIASPFSGM